MTDYHFSSHFKIGTIRKNTIIIHHFHIDQLTSLACQITKIIKKTINIRSLDWATFKYSFRIATKRLYKYTEDTSWKVFKLAGILESFVKSKLAKSSRIKRYSSMVGWKHCVLCIYPPSLLYHLSISECVSKLE